jgi:hypothetical protein
MGERSARLTLPGFMVVASLALAGCAGAHHGNPNGAVPDAGADAFRAVPPVDLVGLDGPSLETLLGKPGLVRRDYPAEVWQYRNPSCVLDVYFYTDAARLTVTHAEARAPEIAGDPLTPCIAKLAGLKRKTTG